MANSGLENNFAQRRDLLTLDHVVNSVKDEKTNVTMGKKEMVQKWRKTHATFTTSTLAFDLDSVAQSQHARYHPS